MATDFRGDRSSLDLLPSGDRIDVVCDAFETAWHDNRAPTILEFLDSCAEPERETLFSELLLVDVEFRRRRGEQPTKNDYLRQYPQCAAWIEAVGFKYGLEDGSTFVTKREGHTFPFVGARLAQFELLERLGGGAFGEVWKARDTKLTRTVALKIPTGNLTDQELDRFLREGRSAAQLSHPNLVTVHDVGRDGATAYIVSKCIAGESLRTYLNREKPTHKQAAEWSRQLAEGLHHAHEQKVVHRDLKPSNILIDLAGRPCIADFGLAKWSEDKNDRTLNGQLLGTPAYMSPEQARGQGLQADPRMDVYALGVVLYEMLTGRRPFDGEHAAMIHQVLNDDPPPPRSIDKAIPRDLETICLKAMEKEPGRRYATAQEMAVDLSRFLRGDVIHARRATRLERAWRWTRRHPAIVAAVALTLVTLGSLALASKLAQDKHDMLRLQMVRLKTEPAGARVVFVPLSGTTRTPVREDRIECPSQSPVTQELEPGEYLVVAELPDGRFHEVYRYVPHDGNELAGQFAHNRWTPSDDGDIILPQIRIPKADVTNEMVFVSNGVRSGRNVEGPYSIYVDRTEAIVAEFREVFRGLPKDKRWQPAALDQPITVDFDTALAMAEALGKRLPSEAEFEFILDNASNSNLTNGGRIENLDSGVAEWTATLATRVKIPGQPTLQHFPMLSDSFIVRGGDIAGLDGINGISHELSRGEMKSIALPRTSFKPGLGLRCVRSVKPPF